MNGKAKGVEVNTQRTAGRPQVFTHNNNQRFCKSEFSAEGVTAEALILNKIEGAAHLFFRIGKDLAKLPEERRDKVLQRVFDNVHFWYDMGAERGGDFDDLYNQSKNAER